MARHAKLVEQARKGLPATRQGMRGWYERIPPDFLSELKEVVDAWQRGELKASKYDLGRWLEAKIRERGFSVRAEMVVRWINMHCETRQPPT